MSNPMLSVIQTAIRREQLLEQKVRFAADRFEKCDQQVYAAFQQAEKKLQELEEHQRKEAKVSDIKTAVHVTSVGLQVGAGFGLLATGNVLPGALLLGSAAFSIFDKLANHLNWYDQFGDKSDAVRKGMGTLKIGVGIASMAFGGSSGLSAGWDGLTATSDIMKGITNLSTAAQGLMMIIMGRLRGIGGKLQAEHIDLRSKQDTAAYQREEKEQAMEKNLSLKEKLFGMGVHAVKTQWKVTQAVARAARAA